jgi:putative CocE/NonD family hydrolase
MTEAEVEVLTLMVPMRDGVRLATDVYLPRLRPNRLPALLTRTPYSKTQEPAAGRVGLRDYGAYFTKAGYAVVVQDVRGRWASEGTWGFLGHDAEDGVDTCAWIAAQPWSDGQVGMFGTSYPGGTQHAVAVEQAPELKTVIPVDAVSNMGVQGMRNGGAYELRFWNWVFTGGNDVSWRGRALKAGGHPRALAKGLDGADVVQEALQQMSRDRRHYLLSLPLRPGTTPLKHAPEYEQWLVEAMEHGCDDAFWAQNNILADPSRYKDIPVYLVGGWYDSWAGNTSANYQALSRAISGPVYLIMGPWIHGQQAQHAHGQVEFGPDAAIADQLAWRRAWFDRWLLGKDTAVGKSAPFATPVRIFVMGTGDGHKTPDGLLYHGGYWRDEQVALARTQPTRTTCTRTARSAFHRPPNPPRPLPMTSTPATRCPASAATSRPRTASCCRAPTISAAGTTSGTGRSRCRSPPAVTSSSSRPNRSRPTSKSPARSRSSSGPRLRPSIPISPPS